MWHRLRIILEMEEYVTVKPPLLQLYGIYLHECVAKLVHKGGAGCSSCLCMSANNAIQLQNRDGLTVL